MNFYYPSNHFQITAVFLWCICVYWGYNGIVEVPELSTNHRWKVKQASAAINTYYCLECCATRHMRVPADHIWNYLRGVNLLVEMMNLQNRESLNNVAKFTVFWSISSKFYINNLNYICIWYGSSNRVTKHSRADILLNVILVLIYMSIFAKAHQIISSRDNCFTNILTICVLVYICHYYGSHGY